MQDWGMVARMEATLVLEALNRAFGHRQIEPNQVLIHSDQGGQYRAIAYRPLLDINKITASMSAKAVAGITQYRIPQSDQQRAAIQFLLLHSQPWSPNNYPPNRDIPTTLTTKEKSGSRWSFFWSFWALVSTSPERSRSPEFKLGN